MREVSVNEAFGLMYPGRVVLAISVDSKGRPNTMPLGWSMTTSFVPRMVAISVGKTRYSHKLISESKEFVFAVPAADMGKEVLYCGTCSGRDVDKFKELGLKTRPAKLVKPPLIEGCVVNLECKLVNSLNTGDHTIFVGKVVAAHASEGKKSIMLDFGGHKFGSAVKG